jgi:hypothetical protein
LATGSCNAATSNSPDVATTQSLAMLEQEQIPGPLTVDLLQEVICDSGTYTDDAAGEQFRKSKGVLVTDLCVQATLVLQFC